MYVTFASFSLPPSYTGSSGASASAPFDDGGAFPATGVAFQLGDVEIPVRASLDSRFPLRLSNFSVRPAGATAGLRGDQPHELEGSVVADGLDDGAIVFIGPRSSPRLHAALWRMIGSLRFPHLRADTFVNGAYALGAPGEYLVGSFTFVRAPQAFGGPFYLVHPPGRLPPGELLADCAPAASCTPPGVFYAIGAMDAERQAPVGPLVGSNVPGYSTYRCDLRLDPKDDQFYCANGTARWDRFGSEIRVPPGAAGQSLPIISARISWDGHVLVGSDVGSAVSPQGNVCPGPSGHPAADRRQIHQGGAQRSSRKTGAPIREHHASASGLNPEAASPRSVAPLPLPRLWRAVAAFPPTSRKATMHAGF